MNLNQIFFLGIIDDKNRDIWSLGKTYEAPTALHVKSNKYPTLPTNSWNLGNQKENNAPRCNLITSTSSSLALSRTQKAYK